MASPVDTTREIDAQFLELAVSPHSTGSSRALQMLSTFCPAHTANDELSEAQRRGSLTGRVQSYSRVMHSYTMLQMQSSHMVSLPGYQKAIYDFTSKQMKRQRSASKARSETSSPHMMAQQAVQPSPGVSNLPTLSLDDPPPPPCPSPSPEHRQPSLPMSVRPRGRKPRSTTEPIPRDFAMGVKDPTGVACG